MAAHPIPATRIGDYEILATLGSGGMGVVYKARDLKLERIVALKFLSADPADQQRVLREARAASVLDHGNIVALHAVEQAEDGAWFLVMAYCEGRTLEDALRSGPLPASQAIDITAQIARGLAHAHSRGLIHRDIKPANVILTAGGIAKIVDFGLARHFDIGGSTQSGTFSGTLTYMSPEQVNGTALDLRTDIWSLGVVLYRMLTGRLPFAGRSAAEQVWSAVYKMPEAMPGIPEPLQVVVLRALAKLPDQRYADCQELLEDLARLQTDRRRGDTPSRPAAELRRALQSAGAPSVRRYLRRGVLMSVLVLLLALFVVPSLQIMPESVPPRFITLPDNKILANALFVLADDYALDGRTSLARDLFRYAADLRPNDWLGYHKLAAFHFFRERNYEQAAALWRHVIRLNAKNANAHSNLAMALLGDGHLDEAAAELKIALSMEENDGARSNLGMIYYQQKRWAEAAGEYERALKLKPDNYLVWGNLGLALEWLNQRQAAAEAYREQLKLLKVEVARAPDNPDLQSKIGLLYSKQGLRAAALTAVQRALARAPNDPLVLSNAGETFENLGDRARAVDLVRSALEHGETLDRLDHNPGLRRLLADPAFGAAIAQHTRNLAAPRRQ